MPSDKSMKRTRPGPQREDALWSRHCPWCWSPPATVQLMKLASAAGLPAAWTTGRTWGGWAGVKTLSPELVGWRLEDFLVEQGPFQRHPFSTGTLRWRLQTPFQSLTQGPTLGDHPPALRPTRVLQTAVVWHNPCCPQRLYPPPRTTNLTGWTCGRQEPRKPPPPWGEETWEGSQPEAWREGAHIPPLPRPKPQEPPHAQVLP